MPEGFTGKKPIPSFWIEQLEAGEEYRKKQACQHQWDDWRAYYRGDWNEQVQPVNIFFSMLRSTVPRVYFRNPAVSVLPDMPGPVNMAFAQLMHRIDNKMLLQMDFKRQAKSMVQDTFLFGTGAGKLGFGSQYTPNPTGQNNAAPLGKSGKLEYRTGIEPNMPWFMRIHPKNLIWPAHTMDIREARWVAHRMTRPLKDVQDDHRFKQTKDLSPSSREMIPGSGIYKPVDLVDLIEVHDRQTGIVFVIAPGGTSNKGGGETYPILYSGEDTISDQDGFNLFQTVFNEDDESIWGIADAKILEPYQLELNETRTLQMKHRRMSVVKLLVKRGLVNEAEIDKMLSEDVAGVINIDGNIQGGVDKMQIANIPPELSIHASEIMQDVRDTAGFSRNQLGDFQSRRGDTSATEASIVQQASEIRVDERRDVMADLVTDVVKKMNKIIFNHWSIDQVVDVVGPGGTRIWVKVNPKELSNGKYIIKVDPDSTAPRTRAEREARAAQLQEILGENPLIDPVKLTRFVLTELDGVEMDDLMKVLPPVEAGSSPSAPLDITQYAEVLSRSTGSTPQAAINENLLAQIANGGQQAQ